jgi:hypothetical protein
MTEEENVDLGTFLLSPEVEEEQKPAVQALAPTADNLRAALSKANVQTAVHLHEASGLEFKIRAMSSDGYIALNNVTQVNPMTGFPMSTAQEDEHERNLIYLTYGIAEPPLNRESANAVLKTPGWGPSNTRLLDAIRNMNPSAEERVNNFILLMQSSRFLIIFANMLDELGLIDKLAEEYDIRDNVIHSLKVCIASFKKLYKVEFAARAWGLPLTIDKMISDKLPDGSDIEATEEEKDVSTQEHQTDSSS